ncbi:hypothetical protein JCM1840_001692 [Sporobolomyces johnsonii]
MLNGVRQREDDDEAHSGYEDGQEQQRLRLQAEQAELGHYDIYALPSHTPPSPLLQTAATFFQSCSFFIVNRSAGLQTGLGIRIGLSSSPTSPTELQPTTDPGFFLPREQGYDASKAVLLGWVEQERLAELEALVRSCEVPLVQSPPRGGEVLEWILGVGRKLEWEGILANPEILLRDVLDRR